MVLGKNTLEVRFNRLFDYASLPEKSSATGFDVRACMNTTLSILPGKTYKVGLGFSVDIPDGYVILLYSNPYLAYKYGVYLLNSVSVIDSDFRGEVSVLLTNRSKHLYDIEPGDYVARMVAVRCESFYGSWS